MKIQDLHKQYNSNIIRISPLEIHIADPDFFSELYTGNGRKRDVDRWFSDQFGANESHFTTSNHDLHRERRAALAPLFSIATVRNLQPVIEERVDKLLERIRDFREKGEVLDLTLAFPALTNGEFPVLDSDNIILPFSRYHIRVLVCSFRSSDRERGLWCADDGNDGNWNQKRTSDEASPDVTAAH